MLLKLLVRDFANANHKDTWKKKSRKSTSSGSPPNQDFIKLNFHGLSSLTIVHAAIGLIYYQRY